MAQTVVSIRMDEDVKRRFDEFCAEAGMNMSVAFNIFARATLRKRRIPFEIEVNEDPFYSKANQEWLSRAIERVEAGLVTEHELIEVEDEKAVG